MDWKKLRGSITAFVDKELRLRHAYLIAENRMLRQQISGRVHLTVSDRKALAELGQQLDKKALEEMATVAKPDIILAWHRTFAAQQGDRAQLHKSVDPSSHQQGDRRPRGADGPREPLVGV